MNFRKYHKAEFQFSTADWVSEILGKKIKILKHGVVLGMNIKFFWNFIHPCYYLNLYLEVVLLYTYESWLVPKSIYINEIGTLLKSKIQNLQILVLVQEDPIAFYHFMLVKFTWKCSEFEFIFNIIP